MNGPLRFILMLARSLPRGGWPLVRWLARQFPALQQSEIPLLIVPGMSLKADLRESVFFPLWKYGCYPHQLVEDQLAASFLRPPGDAVWDVGANIGYTTVLYRRFVTEKGFVLAFEPSPKAFRYLTESISAFPNVVPLQAAVSDREADLFFEEKQALDTSAVVNEDKCDRCTIKVRSVTLDSMLSTYRPPDFLKIDVEGHEAQVLSGAMNLIRSFHPLIQFEALNEASLHQVLAVLETIAGRDYAIFQIRCDGGLTTTLDTNRTDFTHNFLAIDTSHRQLFQGDSRAGR